MTTPYRNDSEALRERKAALEEETKRLREQRAHLDSLVARQEEIAQELASIDERLSKGAKRRLPTLDQVSVASPCGAAWSEMLGDDRVRFCLSCEKHVYNISAMQAAEAEALIAAQAEGELCIRYYQRADGTIMTADCPVGVTKKRRKKLALSVAGAGALAFGAFAALHRAADEAVMGKMEAVATTTHPRAEPTVPPVATDAPDRVLPSRDDSRYVAGRMVIKPRAPAEETPTPTPTPKAPSR